MGSHLSSAAGFCWKCQKILRLLVFLVTMQRILWHELLRQNQIEKFLIKNALWIHWKSSSENQIFFGIAHLLRIGTKFHFLHVSKETFKKEKNFYSKAEQNWPKLPCLRLYDKWIFLEKTLDNLCHSFGKEISAKSFWRKVIAIS